MPLESKDLTYASNFSHITFDKLKENGWAAFTLSGRTLAELNAGLDLKQDMEKQLLKTIANDNSKLSDVFIDLRRITGFDLWPRPEDVDMQIKGELKRLNITNVKSVIGNVADYLELDYRLQKTGADLFKDGLIDTCQMMGRCIKIAVGRLNGKIVIKGVPTFDNRAESLRYFPLLIPKDKFYGPPWVRPDLSINFTVATMFHEGDPALEWIERERKQREEIRAGY